MEKENFCFRLVKPFNQETMQFNEAIDMRNSIFLAGPCPREDYKNDWRFEAFEILDELGFKGNVITPTNELHKEMAKIKQNAYQSQTDWERTMMHMATAIVFWVPRSSERPAYNTNVEFGEWYKKPGVFLGYPETATHVGYLEAKFKEQGKKSYHDLRAMLSDVVDYLAPQENERLRFTSDTHFGHERVRQLCHRPFTDVREMDLALISNWNKTVPIDAIMYHAGDFIDPEKIDELPILLSNLNYKELHWVLGNYDRKIKEKIEKIVESMDDGRKIIIYEDADEKSICKVTVGDKKFAIIHEPVTIPAAKLEETTYMFGHIHGLSQVKRNGFNLSTDLYQYTPIDEKRILFIEKSLEVYDDNVYVDHVVTVQKRFIQKVQDFLSDLWKSFR